MTQLVIAGRAQLNLAQVRNMLWQASERMQIRLVTLKMTD